MTALGQDGHPVLFPNGDLSSVETSRHEAMPDEVWVGGRWRVGWQSLVVAPHPDHLDGAFGVIDLIDQAMLNVDAA